MANSDLNKNIEHLASEVDSNTERRREFKAFLIIIIFFFPIVTTLVAGSYGFIIWMSQIILGPPGHG